MGTPIVGMIRGKAAAGGGGTYTQIQKVRTDNFGESVTTNLGTAAVANRLLIAVLALQNVASPPSPPSGWSLAGSLQVTASSTELSIRIWYKVAAGGETGVTASWTGNSNADLEVFEYSGNAVTSPLVEASTSDNGAFTGSITTGTVNPTGSALVLAGVILSYNVNNFSNSWTNSFVRQGIRDSFYSSAERIVSSGGAYSTAESWSGTTRALSVLAAFKT